MKKFVLLGGGEIMEIPIPTKAEILWAEAQEGSEFITDREIWIIKNFGRGSE